MEIPFNILLLPFLGGYVFIRFWNYTRIHIMRSDKDRIVIRAAIVGFFSLVIAYSLYLLGAKLFPCSNFSFCISSWWKENVPFEYTGISIAAFFIGFLGWIPLNWLKKYSLENQISRAINEDADPLELMLKRAKDEGLAVSITMINEKVYIGMVTQHTFNPATPTNNIALVPLQSGYRNAETKQMHLTVNYSDAIDQITKELDAVSFQINHLEKERVKLLQINAKADTLEIDEKIENFKLEYDRLEKTSNLFVLVIPANQIASANIFDNEVHTKYFLPSPVDET